MSQTISEVRYNVGCISCGSVFQPLPKSSLWWQAKQRAEKGFLDALCIDEKKCGCGEKVAKPDSPFRVFGFDFECRDFDIPCATFVQAVKTFRQILADGDIVCISGVSRAVEDKLKYGYENKLKYT